MKTPRAQFTRNESKAVVRIPFNRLKTDTVKKLEDMKISNDDVKKPTRSQKVAEAQLLLNLGLVEISAVKNELIMNEQQNEQKIEVEKASEEINLITPPPSILQQDVDDNDEEKNSNTTTQRNIESNNDFKISDKDQNNNVVDTPNRVDLEILEKIESQSTKYKIIANKMIKHFEHIKPYLHGQNLHKIVYISTIVWEVITKIAEEEKGPTIITFDKAVQTDTPKLQEPVINNNSEDNSNNNIMIQNTNNHNWNMERDPRLLNFMLQQQQNGHVYQKQQEQNLFCAQPFQQFPRYQLYNRPPPPPYQPHLYPPQVSPATTFNAPIFNNQPRDNSQHNQTATSLPEPGIENQNQKSHRRIKTTPLRNSPYVDPRLRLQRSQQYNKYQQMMAAQKTAWFSEMPHTLGK